VEYAKRTEQRAPGFHRRPNRQIAKLGGLPRGVRIIRFNQSKKSKADQYGGSGKTYTGTVKRASRRVDDLSCAVRRQGGLSESDGILLVKSWSRDDLKLKKKGQL